MKALKNKLRNLGVVMMSLAPTSIWAALPAAADIADGATVDSGPLAFLRSVFSDGLTIAATGVAALITLGAIFTIYTSFLEAREKNNWKSFGLTAIVGIVMIVGSVVVATLAVDYGDMSGL